MFPNPWPISLVFPMSPLYLEFRLDSVRDRPVYLPISKGLGVSSLNIFVRRHSPVHWTTPHVATWECPTGVSPTWSAYVVERRPDDPEGDRYKSLFGLP